MSRIKFEDFEIDLDLFELMRANQVIEIGAKPLNLLICLISNRNRVVDREFLRNELWKGAELSPATIPTCVLAVRKALGDQASESRLIKSHRARGYRFIGEISRSTSHARSTVPELEHLPFVGRLDELSSLSQSAREMLRQKEGRIVILSGEAGMGKSRTIAEFSRRSKDQFSIITVKAPPIVGTPAFWPWSQLLNRIQSDPDLATPELSTQAQSLSNIFPEIRHSKDGELSGESRTHRFNVFSQWTEVVYSVARMRPTILTVDDTHALDPESLTLLYWIADQIQTVPLMIVATMRPYAFDEATTKILSDVTSLPQTSRLTLAPLSSSEIQEVLDPLGEDNASLAASLAQQTGGNPFYLTHLIRCLDEIPVPKAKSFETTGLPLHAREIVSRQLSGLPKPTQDTLSAASALGDRFPLKHLAYLVGCDSYSLLATVEPAIEAWILREDHAFYEFNHSILRESLYQMLGPSQRRRYHQQAARYLTESGSTSSHLFEIAFHLSNAHPLGDAAETLSHCLGAAREAVKRFAYSQARTILERASSIQSAAPSTTLIDRCDLLLELSQVVLFTGERDESRSIILQAADLAREARSASRLTRCALGLAPDHLSIEVGAHDPALIRLLNEALAMAPASQLSLRATLIARLSQAQQWSAPQNVRQSLADQSLSMARQSEDVDAVLCALTAKAEALHGPLQAQSRLHVLSELSAATDRTPDSPLRLLHHTRLITANLELGNLESVEIENRRHEDLADRVGLPQFRWLTGAVHSMLSTMRGRITDAEEHADSYKSLVDFGSDFNFQQTYACQLAMRSIEQDRTAERIDLFRSFSQAHTLVRSWKAAYAWALLETNDVFAARSILDSFRHAELDELSCEAGGGVGLASLCEVAAAVGSKTQRVDLLRRALEVRDRYASAGYGVAYFGSFARYSGLLAISLDEMDLALDLLRDALYRETRNCAPSWIIYSLITLDEAERRVGIETSPLLERASQLVEKSSTREISRAWRKLKEASEQRDDA